ncbi:MAG: pilus assembly protein [Lachnospiraceae bacterium]|nr:pilus assembly protein [Lachnospiraceae bacterium]
MENIRLYHKTNGSFTVEAALIMPLILGVIVLFIYICLHCYDRCVTEYRNCLSNRPELIWDMNDHV